MKLFSQNLKIILVVIFVVFVSLFTISFVTKKKTKNIETEIKTGGSSGMTKIGNNSFLVVYDVKHNVEGTRLAKLKVSEKGIDVEPIKVSGWGKEGRASDLESICKIPEEKSEFLIAESGNWKGDRGRIFHIKYKKKDEAKVLGSFKIPQLKINNDSSVGDNYEAMFCLPHSKNKYILILGERGGSENNPRGVIRWGILDLKNYKFSFSEKGLKGITVDAPGKWLDLKTKRDITDFYIDDNGIIWASASNDLGDTGPFYSVIYQLGKLNLENKEQPFIVFNEFETWQSVAGFKVESLAGSCKISAGNLSISTEDEDFKGVWRPVLIEQ